MSNLRTYESSKAVKVYLGQHDLLSVKNIIKVRFDRNSVELIKNLFKYFLILLFNGPLRKYYSEEYAVLNDGAHKFGLKTYYVRPLIQIEQLKACGFNSIQLFSILDGAEIPPADYSSIEDFWIYYFCRVTK